MLNKMPKPLYQMLMGLLFLCFIVAACKDKKKEEKPVDATEKVTAPAPTGAASDTLKPKDTTKETVPDH
jgi:hypothetical protein